MNTLREMVQRTSKARVLVKAVELTTLHAMHKVQLRDSCVIQKFTLDFEVLLLAFLALKVGDESNERHDVEEVQGTQKQLLFDIENRSTQNLVFTEQLESISELGVRMHDDQGVVFAGDQRTEQSVLQNGRESFLGEGMHAGLGRNLLWCFCHNEKIGKREKRKEKKRASEQRCVGVSWRERKRRRRRRKKKTRQGRKETIQRARARQLRPRGMDAT
mmetsp:Transcript_37543/g.94395  ORF Transcript_37543/g.94395 Transcript_37543/m.94395 type:complete len:217 (+) Transcript_37543:612-1262(+)